MTDIDKTLEEVRARATNYGAKYGRMAVADDKLKGIAAKLRPDAPEGSVPDKDAWVRNHPEYREAVKDKEQAYSEWRAAEIYMKILLAEVEVWRSREATNRWQDRAHQ